MDLTAANVLILTIPEDQLLDRNGDARSPGDVARQIGAQLGGSAGWTVLGPDTDCFADAVNVTATKLRLTFPETEIGPIPDMVITCTCARAFGAPTKTRYHVRILVLATDGT